MTYFPHDINQYQILECIGSGSTSQVYKAKCLANNKIISIKKIDLELYPLEIEVLRREVAFWSRCHNDNIVDYYGSFISGSVLYMLMEYLAGGSVLDIMREKYQNGFTDEVQIATIVRGILLALNYVHEHDEIHRDIKPGNILISETGVVKIGDFGVAASLLEQGRKRARFTVIGTLSYMAPEVINEEIGYTQNADIWSLGITTYELATGNSPYQNLPQLRIIPHILNSPPPRLPRDGPYSPELKDFVRMCLNHQIANRPSAAALLSHDFIKKAQGGEYLVSTLLSQIPSLETRARRKMSLFEDLSPKMSPNANTQPMWQFPIDDILSSPSPQQAKPQTSSTNASSVSKPLSSQNVPKNDSVEHKGRFNIHITAKPQTEQNLAQQQSQPLQSNFVQQPSLRQQSAPIHQNPQTQFQTQQQQGLQQPDLQQQKDLRTQIAELSAKIEQLTIDNGRFRNQLKVLTARIEALVKNKKA
ncbi:Serine/threonine-protein kinase OSR1 [Tritrichomonas foetus]|uniref:non-specific serine/threonine protein kinase n=1 Tax=Tritrichomonas foetus TaxID=1144522 RepID=A0A1J4JR57_9EUKA|nr:Serine/threonine-protein kinase OSR1 [Tritrichomonas foetus]|eukprot:OHT01515.1 Serine/threonine-protein kinase OSR1 [Tritrichomonas foetus]